ncbi:MAG: hypothetical protein LBL99_01130, partial [Holosporaceae bacterium]|nr:hypothetical protein [Holosporaceae bacterium]
MKKRVAIALLFSAVFSPAFCDDITFINSDNTKYAKDNIFCNGNVIVLYSGKIISADKMTYDKKKEIVYADGNVIVKDEKQNVYFFDSMFVNKDFTYGEGKNIKIIAPDKSRLAAAKCWIKNGKYRLQNAVYTPCYECSEAGNVSWTVKAQNVEFDPESSSEYENAQFEFFGTPIFYTPYLSCLSPNIKRKSGFLVPKFTMASRSGFSVLPKYLWSISESQELIFKPIVTSKIGSVAWAYYGLRFPNGEFNIDASITGVESVKREVGESDYANKKLRKIEQSGYRGHLFSKLRYDIDETWRCGFDINLASDWYYLKRFPFFEGIDRPLESNIKLEGFDGRNYTSVKTAMFQSEYSEFLPKVLPVIERNYSTDLFFGTF